MKKAVVLISMLLVLVFAVNAVADTRMVVVNGKWWVEDDAGNRYPTTSKPLEWKTERFDPYFPVSVVQDQSKMCERCYGIPVDCLGLVCSAGANLRSEMTIKGTPVTKNGRQDIEDGTIADKVHGNVTVYVNFRCYDSTGEWYFVTCSDGSTGFIMAKRILLFPQD